MFGYCSLPIELLLAIFVVAITKLVIREAIRRQRSKLFGGKGRNGIELRRWVTLASLEK